MINHLYHDGSIANQFEVGDRVICKKEEYSLQNTPMKHIGEKGTVVSIHPYSKTSNYHSTFINVYVDNGYYQKNLMSQYTPLC